MRVDSDARAIETDDGVDPAGQPSLLDRGISLPLTLGVLVATVSVIVAVMLRLPELDRWAFSPEEGAIALAARDLVRGNTLPDGMLGQPFVIEWVALFMFLGDTTLSVARVSMAVAGIAGIIALLGLKKDFAAGAIAATMLLLAMSPTLVSASRAVDGNVLVFSLSILLLASLYWLLDSELLAAPALTGVALALLLLSGPLGLPAAILVVLGFVLLRRDLDLPSRSQIIAAGAGFAAAFILSASALLTQPSSIIEAPAESLRLLWDSYLSNIGDGLHLPVLNLIINEPLILLLAILGLVWRKDSDIVRGLAMWSAIALVIVSLLGDAGAGGFGLTLLPLGLLAGIGAIEVLTRVINPGQRWGWPAAFVTSILILVFAFVSIIGLATPDPGRTTGQSAVRFLLVVIVVIIPIGFLLTRIGDRVRGQRIALAFLAMSVLLGAITVRSSVLTVTTWPATPGNLLSSQAMSDGLPVIIDRLHRISRDVTRKERDARMPVGGVGLRIALDEAIEQPFAWYFREYPNLTVFDPDTESPPEGTQVVILDGSKDGESVAPGMAGETYLLQYDEPAYVSSPDWGDMIGDAFSLDSWRQFVSFVINRETEQPVTADEFQLLAIPLIAERFAVSTGPYNLNERAGIGTSAGQFNQPRGIAIDGAGGVYVVDAGNARIQHFDAAGNFDRFIGEGTLALFPGGQGGAGGMALDEDGNLYVADTWNHQIKVFSPSGELLRSWGSFFDAQDDPARADQEPGLFYGPRDVAIHDGLLYVTDTGNERVQVFDLEGQFVRSFGEIGSGTGQLIEPVGIAVSDDGVVFVADSHNGRLARFSIDGEALDPWPVDLWEGQQFFEPYVAVGPDGRVYASDSTSGQIAVFSPSGEPLGPISGAALLRPYDMVVTADGLQLLVTDGLANAVISLSPPPTEQ